jgi:hypothetical protein
VITGRRLISRLTCIRRAHATATYRERGTDGRTADYPVATPGMISGLPMRRALVLRGSMPKPVITHLPMAWHDWSYRWARLRGRTVGPLCTARVRTAAATPVPATVAAWTEDAAAPPLAAAGAADSRQDGSGLGHPWDPL